jgi:hypothetical protein
VNNCKRNFGAAKIYSERAVMKPGERGRSQHRAPADIVVLTQAPEYLDTWVLGYLRTRPAEYPNRSRYTTAPT